jgi:2-dehydro-3-deoxyphosphogluconate aldolase/(4S)-4-hydroxy-2-oxoglutarate aldolase
MTSGQPVRRWIEEIGVVPSLRTVSIDDARFAAQAVASAGIPLIEVTTTIGHAPDIIAELSSVTPELMVGAGTVFDVETARVCVQAGARFISSPVVSLAVVEFALAEGVLAIPGALTPTEVSAALQAGADFIKIFPCGQVGGPRYIHALRGPFPHAALIAVGGVNQQTAAEFIAAGATAIGLGPELIPKKALEHRDEHWITELARRFLQSVHTGRNQKVGAHDQLEHQ